MIESVAMAGVESITNNDEVPFCIGTVTRSSGITAFSLNELVIPGGDLAEDVALTGKITIDFWKNTNPSENYVYGWLKKLNDGIFHKVEFFWDQIEGSKQWQVKIVPIKKDLKEIKFIATVEPVKVPDEKPDFLIRLENIRAIRD